MLLSTLTQAVHHALQAGAWYKSLLMWSMQRSPELWLRDSKAAPQLALTAEQQSRVEQLAALLLCQPADVCRIIQKYPQVGAMCMYSWALHPCCATLEQAAPLAGGLAGWPGWMAGWLGTAAVRMSAGALRCCTHAAPPWLAGGLAGCLTAG